MEISLNKFISSTGYCSRREADALIAAGRVHLNNKIAIVGNRYTPGDEVYVDGVRMKAPPKEKRIVMAFNKPEGITTTTDTNIRGNIIDYINYPKRIFPIGRLDKDSEGLIFLTNDGDIVNKILRAGNKHEKEYAVQVDKPIDISFLRKMAGGVIVDGEQTLPCKMKQTGKQSFNIILVQGLNRQIRKMCESLGYKVTSLQRTRIMHINLAGLRVGKWRLLSEPEMIALNSAIEGSSADGDKKSISRSSSSEKLRAPYNKTTQPLKRFVGDNTNEGRKKSAQSSKRSVSDNTYEGRSKSDQSSKSLVANKIQGNRKSNEHFLGDGSKQGKRQTTKPKKQIIGESSNEVRGLKRSNPTKRNSSKPSSDTKNKSTQSGSFKSYRIRGRKN